MKATVVLLSALLLVGCLTPRSIRVYREIAPQISLGDSKDHVLELLKPSEYEPDPTVRKKAPDQFVKNGVRTYIYYVRSAVFNDAMTTDDEFTPYVFENDVLVAIGWEYLGGPKTKANRSATAVP
jgi:hypothetical protein